MTACFVSFDTVPDKRVFDTVFFSIKTDGSAICKICNTIVHSVGEGEKHIIFMHYLPRKRSERNHIK